MPTGRSLHQDDRQPHGDDATRRGFLKLGLAGAAAATAWADSTTAVAGAGAYADPANPALPPSGADFMPEYKKYILDGKTIVTSPHKVYGPEANDLVLQLRKRRVDQVILAGMSANLCVEAHLRELLEQGFEVAVVRDATAAARLPEEDGYLAALINFRYIANALWTTDRTVALLAG